MTPSRSRRPAQPFTPTVFTYQPGEVIADGLIVGRVLFGADLEFGRLVIPSYQVIILSGHETGGKSFISVSDARLATPEEAATEGDRTPICAGVSFGAGGQVQQVTHFSGPLSPGHRPQPTRTVVDTRRPNPERQPGLF